MDLQGSHAPVVPDIHRRFKLGARTPTHVLFPDAEPWIGVPFFRTDIPASTNTRDVGLSDLAKLVAVVWKASDCAGVYLSVLIRLRDRTGCTGVKEASRPQMA